VEKLLAHPMLDGGAVLAEADAALVSLMGGPDLTMAEINRVMEQISQQCGNAQIIMGAAVDETFRDRLSVTVIATRHGARTAAKPTPVRSDTRASADEETPDFDSELLHHTELKRPPSRLVPPTPALTTEQREEILARQTSHGVRPRKKSPRLKQTQLPLEIVTKGRFDKTEPTVHKGEDLDLPTYVRRGVALN
jgi:cell division protein FtsZ